MKTIIVQRNPCVMITLKIRQRGFKRQLGPGQRLIYIETCMEKFQTKSGLKWEVDSHQGGLYILGSSVLPFLSLIPSILPFVQSSLFVVTLCFHFLFPFPLSSTWAACESFFNSTNLILFLPLVNKYSGTPIGQVKLSCEM